MNINAPPKSVLDPERHKRLLEDLEHICSIAHVPQKHVRESMVGYCDSLEIDWVTNFRLYRETYPGLLIEGHKDSTDRCMAIAGALLRNFIDARVVSVNKILEYHETNSIPEPTVLVISNLQINNHGKPFTAWQLAVIYDVLVRRWTANLPTVVAIDNMDSLKQTYGLSFGQFLEKYKR
jgi:hypothetical protein